MLDSLGIGEMPDADVYKDKGSNTLKSLYNSGKLNIPCLRSMGLFNIDGVDFGDKCTNPTASFARMIEKSCGKDTTVGHWEIMGVVSEKSFPVYPDGFPDELISEFEKRTSKKVVCNKPYSGTEVILDYGKQHEESGDLIVYTSSDSVFQIAAKEEVVPLKELYKYCEIARDMLKGEHNVGRVIARPFIGQYPNYVRTPNRHDYSIAPPQNTTLDLLKSNGYDVISVGKISDIFAGRGITESHPTKSNKDGMEQTFSLLDKKFNGLCFVNLVDFDSVYGHRNNISGYTEALNSFDVWLNDFKNNLKEDDILIITADHGCDPATESTDHSREYTPMIVFGKKLSCTNLGTRSSFSDIGKTILDLFDINNDLNGKSFVQEIKRID